MSRPTSIPKLQPGTGDAEASKRLLEARWADVHRCSSISGENLDAKAIHDCRVAIRRFRTTLQVLGTGAEAKSMRRDLKVVQDALGRVRDEDVQQAWLGRFGPWPAEVPAVRQLLRMHGAARRQRSMSLNGVVRDWKRKTPQLASKIHALHPPKRALKKEGKRILKKLRKLRPTMEANFDFEHRERVHPLRIRLKKLRYRTELIQHLAPHSMEKLLHDLAKLQSALGDLHDLDLRLDELNQLPPALEDSASALRARLMRERARLAQSVGVELKRWKKAAHFRRLKMAID